MVLQTDLCLCTIFEVKYYPLVLVDRDGFHRFPPTLVTVGTVGIPDYLAGGFKCGLYLMLTQNRRGAFIGFSVPVVAVPNDIAICVPPVVPDLAAIEAPTVTADELCAKGIIIPEPRSIWLA